jgi:hypothetical protein
LVSYSASFGLLESLWVVLIYFRGKGNMRRNPVESWILTPEFNISIKGSLGNDGG